MAPVSFRRYSIAPDRHDLDSAITQADAGCELSSPRPDVRASTLTYAKASAVGAIARRLHVISADDAAGMWLAPVTAFNVWFAVLPRQKQVHRTIDATDEGADEQAVIFASPLVPNSLYPVDVYCVAFRQ